MAARPAFTRRSEVYFWRQALKLPFPPLKTELAGSQAMSPAAAMTGSEAASAVTELPARLPAPGKNRIDRIKKSIEAKYLSWRIKLPMVLEREVLINFMESPFTIIASKKQSYRHTTLF